MNITRVNPVHTYSLDLSVDQESGKSMDTKVTSNPAVGTYTSGIIIRPLVAENYSMYTFQ